MRQRAPDSAEYSLRRGVALLRLCHDMLKAGLAHILRRGADEELIPVAHGEAVEQRGLGVPRHAEHARLTEIAPHGA